MSRRTDKLTREAVATVDRALAKKSYRFERFKDRRGKFRFRFVAPNGEPMLQSEGYETARKRNAAIKRIQEKAADAKVIDE